MLKRLTEYLAFGAGRPLGVLWAVEKAYFDVRRRFPGKDEEIYLRLTLQSRYPEKDSSQVGELLSNCHNLEDAMVKAISIDFTPGIAATTRMNVLWNLPPCARCGKYGALSTTDDLCYGCRRYPGFSACTHCHLFWDDSPKYCEKCGGKMWRLTDGPCIPLIPLETTSALPSPAEGSDHSSHGTEALTSQLKEEGKQFLDLAMRAESLEDRCAKVWQEGLAERQAYRAVRRNDPIAARNMALDSTKAGAIDESLIADLDVYFDALCDFYLRSSDRDRADLRIVIGSSKRLAGNLFNYAGRTSARFRENGGDPESLFRALAAISLDDGRTGREINFVLEGLWELAALHECDAANAFSAVAKMSEPDTREILASFGRYDVQACLPHELSEDEITRCLSLIREGGAVDSASAAEQLRQARRVALVRIRNEIVGVGVIKQPRPQYASGIARKSEFPFDANMLELGYVAREPSHRGHHLSEKVVSKLLSALPGAPLFATTSNEKMKQTLKAAGFVQQGGEWEGRNKDRLSLWVKLAEAK